MITKLTRDELMIMMGSGNDFKLVDVLAKESYDKEHIKGAISLPLNEIEEKAGQFLRKTDKIVVYCASFECQASTKAADKLLSMGYQDVVDYKGGLKDYKEADLPLEGSMHEHEEASCVGYACCDCT